MTINEYKLSCDIIEKLEEYDSRELGQLAIMLVANLPESRNLIIGQYMDVLNEDMMEE